MSGGPAGLNNTAPSEPVHRRGQAVIEALENERGELLRVALTVASSRSWRLAQRLSRMARRLTFRSVESRSELDILIERLVNLELRCQPLDGGAAPTAGSKKPVRGQIEVILWGARSADELTDTIDHLRRTGARNVRIMTTAEGQSWEDDAANGLDVVHPPATGPPTLSAAADVAVASSDAELVVLLRAGMRVPADWLGRLRRAASSAGQVAMVATLSDAGLMPLKMRERPSWLTPDAVALLAGGDPGERLRVSVLDVGCFALVPGRLAKAGGLDPLMDDLQTAAVDLASRLHQHGGACVLADDVLVHETREDGRTSGRRRRPPLLRAAHDGRRHVRSGIRSMIELERAISSVASDPTRFGESVAATGRTLLSSLWVLPDGEVQGRAHVLAAAADVAGLRQLGLPAQLAVPAVARQQLPDADAADAVVFDNEERLAALAANTDVIVAVTPEALPLVTAIEPVSHSAVIACVLRAIHQRVPDANLDGVLMMAPSRWLCERLADRFGIAVEQFVLSADSRHFHPTTDEPTAETRLQVAAWLRPATATKTLALLARLAESLPPGASLVTFGASLAALDRRGAPQGPWRERHLGTLPPRRLAGLLGQTDILVDLTKDLPTGELAAAAMACGAIPIVHASSGAAEVIDDGRDGIIVADDDPDGWHDAILAIDRDWPRLRSLQTAAIQSATKRTPLLTAISQYILFERARRRRRATTRPKSARELS